MKIEEIRRHNVALIIDKQCGGTKSVFAEKIKKQASYVSRWFSNGMQRRNIDNATARAIEETFKLPDGWLDKLQDVLLELSTTDYLRNQLMMFYDKLSADSKHKLVNFANTLLRDEQDIDLTSASPFKKKEKQ
jgi:hypothetical protein